MLVPVGIILVFLPTGIFSFGCNILFFLPLVYLALGEKFEGMSNRGNINII